MPDALFSVPLADAEATDRFGAEMAKLLHKGDVLLLDGPIGAGKTHFARAVIRSLLAETGVEEDIPSPTFTLVQTYAGRDEIWHSDLYRLTSPDEVIELGLDEAFDTAICLVEWPDRLGELTPKHALRLDFAHADGGESRVVTFHGPPEWGARLARLREAPDV